MKAHNWSSLVDRLNGISMAINIAFKKLFRLEIMHEYYLSHGFSEKENGGHASFFKIYDKGSAKWTAEDEKNINRFLSVYSNMADLEILPTEKTQQVLKGHRMLMKRDGKGFVVGIEINQKTAAGLPVLPMIAIGEGVSMAFKIRVKNANWMDITAMNLRQGIPGVYYFDNDNEAGLKKYPSLSVVPPELNKALGHEMGELVLKGNKLKETLTFIDSESTAKDLKSIAYNAWYVNQNDRLLVQPIFVYRMPGAEVFNKATVSFANEEGVAVLEMEHQSSQPLSSCPVDARSLPVGKYLFSIKTDTGFSEERKIIIDSGLYDEMDKRFNTLGVIRVFNKKNNGAFGLLNEDGSLKTELDQFGNNYPVFQVRFKNRSTYRRYVLPTGLEVDFDKTKTKNIDFSLLSKGLFSTKSPIPLTKKPAKIAIAVKNESNITKTIFLKNPEDSTLTQVAGKFVSNIYLSKSDLVVV